MRGRKIIAYVAAAATIGALVDVASTPVADAKSKPPAKVSKAHVSAVNANAVALTWKNPGSSKFKSTVVRFSGGTYAPTSRTRGRNGGTIKKKRHGVILRNLVPGSVYSVSLFAYYGKKKYAKPVKLRVQTAPAAVQRLNARGKTNSITVRWAHSPSRTAVGLIVRFQPGSAPRTTRSGYGVRVANGKATYAQLNGLRAGSRYGVSVWAYDSAHRLSPVSAAIGLTAPATGGGATTPKPTTTPISPTTTPTTTPPTDDPTTDPTDDPTTDPTDDPTTDPTDDPTTDPTDDPTDDGGEAPQPTNTTTTPGAPTTTPPPAQPVGNGALTGIVTAKTAGAPTLAGVEVILDRYDTDGKPVLYAAKRSDSTGQFTFVTLADGKYRFRVNAADAVGGTSKAGYLNQVVSNFTVKYIKNKPQTQSFSLDPASGVTGKVVDSVSKQVLSNAVVSAANSAGGDPVEDWSDIGGNFNFVQIPPSATSQVCVTAYGEDQSDASTGYLQQCRAVPAQLALTPGAIFDFGTINMTRGAAINGSIDLNYADGAMIYAFDSDGNVLDMSDALKGDATTRYKLSGMPTGTAYLCVKSLDTSHLSECYDGSPTGARWDGNPSSVAALAPTPITLVAGQAVSGSYDFRLDKDE